MGLLSDTTTDAHDIVGGQDMEGVTVVVSRAQIKPLDSTKIILPLAM